MAKLEDLKLHASVHGVIPDSAVSVVQVQWYGSVAIELTFKDESGRVDSQLLYRQDEPRLELVESEEAWRFDANGALFRLACEAQRLRQAHLFDSRLAVHTSDIEPLPHQITAVYETMLPRQPLRFLLADDPGAGKTIMAGLLIKELLARGDVKRCLIVCPGNLVEQWQDELARKFQLPFEIDTTEKLAAARTGNWFAETDLAIARLDKLARDEDVQARLKASDAGWDLIVCDEAHKMSASRFGNEVKYTKRYRLGQLLSGRTRNFLLMTATPHNGKEVDFQLFLALLDADRFAGARDDAHQVDVDDLMRRMVKEKLRRFDGQLLFPERIAHTLPYGMSGPEARLYQEVTEYVRREFNRADEVLNKQRRGTVGFALTILQRRLASSPAAIQQSLRRRRERLLERQREVEAAQRADALQQTMSLFDQDDLDDFDRFDRFDEASEAEVEELDRTILDQATASQTIAELKAEIATLRGLERLAREVKPHVDTKWRELSQTLSKLLDLPRTSGTAVEEAAPSYGSRPIPPPQPSRDQKIVIFTEHRDTLDYLHDNITRLLLGRGEAVAVIHGGLRRGERRQEQERFLHDANVHVLLATDAASEGINLQRAHLMVNYDLPWNPNRIEQRFGRIHRIGQTEVCHLFNLVSAETREGDVYARLLEKLETARQALGGQVFDVLGQLQFEGRPLRDLLIEAIRSGDQPDVRHRLETVVEGAVDTDHFTALLEQNALAPELMDESRVASVRSEMERAAARRLQPYFVQHFFLDAFRHLGGQIRQRESRRYQITYVPAALRERANGRRDVLPRRYERVTFERSLIAPQDQTRAGLVGPAHPLFDATIELTLERYRDLLRRGAILVDERDPSLYPRMIFYAQHAIHDASQHDDGKHDASQHDDGKPRTLSQRMFCVELSADGAVREIPHGAPHLDLRPLTQHEPSVDAILQRPECAWIDAELEQRALQHLTTSVAPAHLRELQQRQQRRIDKTRAAVQERLTTQIIHWDSKAARLKRQEADGNPNAQLSSQEAFRHVETLSQRQQERLQELKRESDIRAAPPVVLGGLLVAPIGLISAMTDTPLPDSAADVDTQAVAARARDIVMATERALGFQPRDVELERCGYDIVSVDPSRGSRRFIEVKGRRADAATLTVTRNEIMIALNRPDSFILAMVRFDSDADGAHELRYLRQPFGTQLDGAEVSVDYKFKELWQRASAPS